MLAAGGIPVNFPRCTSQKGVAGHRENAQKPARAFFGPQGSRKRSDDFRRTTGLATGEQRAS